MNRKIKVIAHRGASAEIPGNTISAFKKAIEVGADMIELDVHASKDGHLVVIHDFTVDETTNGSGAVAELTLAELKELVVEDVEKIPTLEEVFQLAKGKIDINVEIKAEGIEQKVVDLIRKYGLEKNVLISSFNLPGIKIVKEIAPELKTAALLSTPVEDILGVLKEYKADAINPFFVMVNEEFVKTIHDAGYQIYPWTVDDEDMMQYLIELNVDGIITDVPEILIDILKNSE